MTLKKQLLSTEELLKLMDLQGELPKYQLEYGKLLNAYLIMERDAFNNEGLNEGFSRKETEKTDSNRVEKKESRVKTSSEGKLTQETLKEASKFLHELQDSDVIKTTKRKENSSDNTDNAEVKKKYSYEAKAFEGDKKSEAIQLYKDGYSLKEIDKKLHASYNTAGQTLRSIDWYDKSASALFYGSNSIKVLTGKLKGDAQSIMDLGIDRIATTYNLSPEVAEHFFNRAKMTVDGSLYD